MSAQAVGTSRPRGALRLLIDPLFGVVFWGKLLSVVGVWTHSLVAAVVVHEATGSALMVGLVGVVQFGPQLLLSPTSGKWTDRGNPIRQIYLGRIISTSGSVIVAVWLTVADGQHATAAVLSGTLLVGVGFVIGGPAMQSIVPSLIRPGELPTAMALNAVPMTIGRTMGPLVGALVTLQFSAPMAFAISAVTHIVMVLMMLCVRFPHPAARRAGADYRVRAAFRYVWSDRPLFLALLAVTAIGFASDPSITLAPSVAAELDGGTRLIGALSAAFGVGAATGLVLLAVLRGRLSAGWTSLIGLLLLAMGSVVLTVAVFPWLALAGYGLAGLGFGIAMAGLGTVVQERAPEELRGRIMALWLVGFVGSRPLAAAVLGGAADLTSTRVAFAICAVVVLVVACFTRPRRFSTIPANVKGQTVAFGNK